MTGHPSTHDRFAPFAGSYLDSASYGIPPLTTIEALQTAAQTWSTGEAKWYLDWDPVAERCRELLGAILGTRSTSVALIPAVSVGVSLVASGFGTGDEILLPDDEFSSLLLPLRAAALERGATVRLVPYAHLLEEVTAKTALVAVSHVKSKDGGTVDLPRLAAAARTYGAAVLLDVTHSAGILPVEMDELGLDFVVGAAYQHLLCPRGVSFLAVEDSWVDRLVPRSASWRGQSDAASIYGRDLDALSRTAARFDVSLDWHAWVGARPSLEFLSGVPAAERHDHCVGLASSFAAGLELPATGSSVIGLPIVGDRDVVRGQLDQARLRVAVGEGWVRVSFHLYNDAHDVARGRTIIGPLIDRNRPLTYG